jgi:hypothetical protein
MKSDIAKAAVKIELAICTEYLLAYIDVDNREEYIHYIYFLVLVIEIEERMEILELQFHK